MESKLRPAVPPAATRSTASFLLEKGQIPTQQGIKSSSNPLAMLKLQWAPKTGKLITLEMANKWIDALSKNDKTALAVEEELGQQDPALRCLVKYLRKITYSEKYTDDSHEYRHVTLPRAQAQDLCKVYADKTEIGKLVEKVFDGKLLSEDEWRKIGVQQSVGWVHYCSHRPEPNILLFSRPLPQPAPQPTPSSELSNKMGRLLSLH